MWHHHSTHVDLLCHCQSNKDANHTCLCDPDSSAVAIHMYLSTVNVCSTYFALVAAVITSLQVWLLHHLTWGLHPLFILFNMVGNGSLRFSSTDYYGCLAYFPNNMDLVHCPCNCTLETHFHCFLVCSSESGKHCQPATYTVHYRF
jgi:hypothetical protein